MPDSLPEVGDSPRLAVAKWLHAWDNPPPDSWERSSGSMHGFYLARADELIALMQPPPSQSRAAPPRPAGEEGLLPENYWCGCTREARWTRCARHQYLDHDEEPPTQAEEAMRSLPVAPREPREPSEQAVRAALELCPPDIHDPSDDQGNYYSLLDDGEMRECLRAAYAVDFGSSGGEEKP